MVDSWIRVAYKNPTFVFSHTVIKEYNSINIYFGAQLFCLSGQCSAKSVQNLPSLLSNIIIVLFK